MERQEAMHAEAERHAHESRELAAKLLDAYGDSSSPEDLQRAVEVYETEKAAMETRR